MPPKKKRGRKKKTPEIENHLVQFCKNEIVWVKMKFHPPWPAKLQTEFSIQSSLYEKKTNCGPKQ